MTTSDFKCSKCNCEMEIDEEAWWKHLPLDKKANGAPLCSLCYGDALCNRSGGAFMEVFRSLDKPSLYNGKKVAEVIAEYQKIAGQPYEGVTDILCQVKYAYQWNGELKIRVRERYEPLSLTHYLNDYESESYDGGDLGPRLVWTPKPKQ